MINSRNLDDLLPEVKSKALKFESACAAEGIDILFTSTYRDNECQSFLYAQGRTRTGPNASPTHPLGNVATNAEPGMSYHNWRCAFDFVPMVNGKPVWNDLPLFDRCGEIAESVELEWAGRWTTFKELAHCQYTGGLTIADFQSGKTLENLA
jgi:peptidoglycan L-alanyl-D-glutamate endopeptidase CwlK